MGDLTCPAGADRPLPPAALARLAAFVARLRPVDPEDGVQATHQLRREIERLGTQTAECACLRADLLSLLAMDDQNALYAEAGVQPASGFPLELRQRLGWRMLPRIAEPARLDDTLAGIFPEPQEYLWVEAIEPADWLRLAQVLGLDTVDRSAAWLAATTLLDAARLLSYRIAGAGLDRELLRNEPALYRHESPFLAQNVEFVAIYQRALDAQGLPEADDLRHLGVLLAQCTEVIARVRRRAREQGTSVRLTYLLARLEQLIARLHLLLGVLFGEQRALQAVSLFKTLLRAFKTRDRIVGFIGENINLLARNITENASRHGEHYIANNRRQWLSVLGAAALGGIVIGAMAAIKLMLAKLHLPPLSEGLAFGLNYALGFALIHMLGGVVATKQPAMTATTLAAGLDGARPKEIGRLAELLRDVARTQYIAILGNVLLAVPVALVIALAWPKLFFEPLVDTLKAAKLLADLHPLASGALGYAAVAGVGLFLSGLVAGYYDNRLRYQRLAERIAAHPRLDWLSPQRRTRLSVYIDQHYGAILGNLFFGFFLGLVGSLGPLTGLPVDIRHVAFASANIGTALAVFDFVIPSATLVWSAIGVVGIGLVNLLVSFSLALYVAMRSRQQNLSLLPSLLGQTSSLFLRRPWSFLTPPGSTSARGEI